MDSRTRNLLWHSHAALLAALAAPTSSVMASTMASGTRLPQHVSRDYVRQAESGSVTCQLLITVETVIDTYGHDQLYVHARAKFRGDGTTWLQPMPQAVELNEFERHDMKSWIASLLSEVRISGQGVARA